MVKAFPLSAMMRAQHKLYQQQPSKSVFPVLTVIQTAENHLKLHIYGAPLILSARTNPPLKVLAGAATLSWL